MNTDQIIEEFGRRIGLPDLALSNGVLALTLDDSLVFTVETLEGPEESLLVALSHPVADAMAAEAVAQALKRTSWRNALKYPMSAGLYRGRLILSLRLEGNALRAAEIENALRFLLEESAELG